MKRLEGLMQKSFAATLLISPFEAAARRDWANDNGDKLGFYKRPTIDEKGVATVRALRSKYAEPKKELGAPTRYYDTQYLQRALGAP